MLHDDVDKMHKGAYLPAMASEIDSNSTRSSVDIDLRTVDQVASELGVSTRVVLSLIARGRLPGAVKVGREYRIPHSDVLGIFEKKRLERENETARAGRDADPGASSGAGATA